MSHRNGQHNQGNRFDDSESGQSRKGRPHSSGNGKHSDASRAPESPTGSQPRSLSEISHLFLSDLRSASGHGRQPPKRIPPNAKDKQPRSAPASNEPSAGSLDSAESTNFAIPPVSAVIGARLGGTLLERASQYASGLADELPIGLLVIERDGVRLFTVAQGDDADPALSAEVLDDIGLRAAVLEMSCDIARWLVVLPDPRLPQARRLLADIREWVLLLPADHEGVVSGYRVLKGLCDLELPSHAEAPRVTLALVDAADAREAKRHARRLVGVCKQFLDLEVETTDVDDAPAAGAVSSIGAFTRREIGVAPWLEGADSPALTILEQLLSAGTANQAPTEDSEKDLADALLATSAASGGEPQPAARIPDAEIPAIARPVPTSGFFADDWVGASEDLSRVERRLEKEDHDPACAAFPRRKHILDLEIPDLALPLAPARQAPRGGAGTSPVVSEPPGVEQALSPIASAPQVGPRFAIPTPSPLATGATGSLSAPGERGPGHIDDVIDLPAGGSVSGAVSLRLGFAQTPIAPPMLMSASLCVSREGAVVVVAAAAPGLEDLPMIGRALTWATENRLLLRMALTQYRVDDSREVLLHLLVSRADVNADALRPLMVTGRVTVQAYRQLNWGGRSGLLLEAA